MKIKFTEIVLVFVRFLCRNCSFYFVLVFWITIILVLVLWKRRPIILILVLIFVTKITLVTTSTHFDTKLIFFTTPSTLCVSAVFGVAWCLSVCRLSVCHVRVLYPDGWMGFVNFCVHPLSQNYQIDVVTRVGRGMYLGVSHAFHTNRAEFQGCPIFGRGFLYLPRAYLL